MTDQSLLGHCSEELKRYDRLYLGFSGGLDSTVLLHILAGEPFLKLKLQAVHVNHGLSVNAQSWQSHCQQFCQKRNIPYTAIQVSLANRANLEEAARMARYQALTPLIKENDCLLMGHHLDDQAETLLLQLFRGAGIDGLTAITEQRAFGRGTLFRPLLSIPRQHLEYYAQEHQLSWIEDESNQDVHFSRNFLRQTILPLLQERWPGINQNLARTSQHCRHAQENLRALAELDCPALATQSCQLPLQHLKQLKPARLNNVLRYWLQKNQVRMPATSTFNRLRDEIILAGDDANGQVEWDGVCVRRYRQCLYLLPLQHKQEPAPLSWPAFPQPLVLPEARGYLTVSPTDSGLVIKENSQVEVRFRVGGETLIWHGQKKSLKKLMQIWNIPPWLRSHIPLIYVDGQLAQVLDYAISDLFYDEKSDKAIQIKLRNEGVQ